MREIRQCVICGGTDIRPVLARPAVEFIGARMRYYNLASLGLSGQEVMGYARCAACSFTFASPALDDELEDATYNEAKEDQLAGKQQWLSDADAEALYQTHHKWVDLNPFVLALGFHFARFRRPHNPGQSRLRLLDWGCGYGHTLELARTFGLSGTGCDVDRSRVAACLEKGLHAVAPAEVEGTFDIVVSSNVIEHVYDLSGYVDRISRHLAVDGVFAFSGLDESVIPLELRKRRFKLVAPIEHRNILTRKSLSTLLKSHGLRFMKRREIFDTMRLVRSKAPLYLPYLITRGFVVVNGVFTAIAKRAA